MANYSHKNVIVGAAAVYISVLDSTVQETTQGAGDGWIGADGREGPALPTFTPNQKAEVAFDASNDWRSAGYTTDGVEVSYEPDYGEVTVDQALDSVKMFKQGMRVAVNTTLSEATLENLLVAWGQQSSTLDGDDSLAIAQGELGDDPVERALAFVGPAPRGTGNEKRERVYHLRRSLQVESSAHSLSRADATTFPVSFRCMAVDDAVSGQDYGVILQRAVTA